MITREEAIDTYIAGWNTDDPAVRLSRLEASCAQGVIYCDPSATVAGLPALADHVARTRKSFPGCTLVRTTRINSHGSFARFGWQMRGPDGKNLPESLDVVEFGPDGRVVRIIGFFGPLRPL